MSMFGGNNYNSGSSAFSGTQVGGGFMNDSQNNQYGNENYNTSNMRSGGGNVGGGGQKVTIPYDQRKLAQVTIKQIQKAPAPQPDSSLAIDGVEVTQVSMVAQIRTIDLQSSHTTLTINDLTGSLQAKKWANDNQAPDTSTNLVEGQWIRIYGRLNLYGGRCSINIYEIFPITDPNEITHHFLECIHAHLYNTTSGHSPKTDGNYGGNNMVNKGSNYGGNNNRFMGNNGNNNGNFNNNVNNNNMGNNNGMQIGGNNVGWGNNGGSINSNISPVENKVLNIIKAPQYENDGAGCNIDTVFQQLSNEDVNAIRTAIDSLADAGYIYSTVDEDHYKYAGDQQ